jgi:hypothetical protein
MHKPFGDNFGPIGQEEPIVNLLKNHNLKTKGCNLVNLVSIDTSFKAP